MSDRGTEESIGDLDGAPAPLHRAPWKPAGRRPSARETGTSVSDEPLVLSDDPSSRSFAEEASANHPPPWKVLVVDDDDDIHAVTRFTLRRLTFDGRGVTFLDARGVAEALALLSEHPDVAVALVDVVMETDHAGLDLVRAIREDRGDSLIRVVLRTGQPGTAPEREVIADHDINGYIDKTEATVDRLWAAVTTALRTYRDLKRLDDSRKGLRRAIAATGAALAADSLAGFASDALRWLSDLMGDDGRLPSGFSADPDDGMRLTAATGRFADKVGLTVGEIVATGGLDATVAVELASGQVGFRGCDGGPTVSAELRASSGARHVLHIERAVPADALETDLLRLFTANLAVAHENLHLRDDMRRSERDMTAVLARALERHDPSMGHHARRVAEIARVLLMALRGDDAGGSAADEARDTDPDTLTMAAMLHDIGMITVPVAVTDRPEPLSAEDWRAVRSHCRAGHELLRRSTSPVGRLGAVIALTHHERWDGRGYPDGLAGEAVPLAGRLVSLAEQFDAMTSPRPHRAALSEDRAVELMTSRRGEVFDPALVDLFVGHLATIRAVRHRFRDEIRRTDRP